jgi:hypothetical protein
VLAVRNTEHGTMSFREALRVQRWDDHRYYHHSRINQALHLLSALCFVASYVLLFANPALAALLGWSVAMTARQAGHFFFEPRDYDVVNQATHAYKESIKVGYNLRRKVVLMGAWLLSPLLLLLDPALQAAGGIGSVPAGALLTRLGWLWLGIGIAGLAFRTVQLFFLRDLRTGLVWLTKILTDPFHDIRLYHRAPLHLLRGELVDPMSHGQRA